MTFNQRFTFTMLTVILLFNLVSILTEFSYFTSSQCGAPKPTYLPMLRTAVPHSYKSYLQTLSFFSGLGLFFNFAVIGVAIFLSYKEVKHKDFLNTVPMIFFLPKLRKTFLLVSFMFGSNAVFLMPMYTYDYM